MEGHIITAGYCFPIKTHFSTQLSISVNCDFIQRLLWLIDRCCWRLVLLIQVSGIWSESQQAASQRQTLELIFFVAQLLADFFLQNCTHWGILLKSTAVLQAITKILVKKSFFLNVIWAAWCVGVWPGRELCALFVLQFSHHSIKRASVTVALLSHIWGHYGKQM